MTTPGDTLMTLDDLAEELAVSKSTLHKWAGRGAPDFPRALRLPNGGIRVRRADLALWLDARTEG